MITTLGRGHVPSGNTQSIPGSYSPFRDGSKKTLLSITVMYIILITFFVLMASLSQEAARELTRESGIVENLQAIFYFGSAAIFFHLYKTKLSVEGYPFIGKIVILGFFALFLFVAFEEISWGQRIIGFGTPDIIEENNFQDEATFHNLGNYWKGIFFYSYSIAIATFVFVLGILLPVLKCLSAKVMEFIERYKIPLPRPELVFGFVIGPLFIYKEDHFALHILTLVVAASIVVSLLVLSKCNIFRLLKNSRLFRLQALTIMLAVFGVAVINHCTHQSSRTMAEIKEFFIALSFLLFGILARKEMNSKGNSLCE